MYGFCVFCNRNLLIPKRGRPKLYCCAEHRVRHRQYKYAKAKNHKFQWHSDSEKSAFFQTQRRMVLAQDPYAFVKAQLASMHNPDTDTIEELRKMDEPIPEQPTMEDLKEAINNAEPVIAETQSKPAEVKPAETFLFSKVLLADTIGKTRFASIRFPEESVKVGDVLKITVTRLANVRLE